MPSGMDGRPDESQNWGGGSPGLHAAVGDQGSLPLFSLGSGQRRGGRRFWEMGRFLRSGLGSEKGSSPVCLLGGRRVGMWTAARSGSGQRPRPAPRFTGTHPRTDDASSPAAGFSYLDAWWWWWGGSMSTLLTRCSVMGHGSAKPEGQADLGQLPLTSPGTPSLLISWSRGD